MANFLALKSYYINQRFNLKSFYNPQIAPIIKGRRILFFNIKQNCFFITKDILKKIMNSKLFLVHHFYIDIIFKIIQADLIKIEKLIYIVVEAKNVIFV